MMRRRAGGGGDLPAYGGDGVGGAGGYGDNASGGGGGGGGGDQGYGGYGGYTGGGGNQGYGGYGGGGGGGGAGATYEGYGSSPAAARRRKPDAVTALRLYLPALGILLLILLSGLLYGCVHYRGMYRAAAKERDDANKAHRIVHQRYNDAERRVRDAEVARRTAEREVKTLKRNEGGDRGSQEEVRILRDEINKCNAECAGQMDRAEKVREQERQVERERNVALEGRANKLKEHIGRESYRSALERFGPGPHNITIQVQLPPSEDKSVPENPSFTIQLHPLDKMPHSVNLFLEQVAHGLWDGCSFVINADHILQAVVHHGDDDGKEKAFEEKRLDRLSFQEYSNDYPHVPYTVGFAGRPGGPDFYINKLDNTETHGPHGQSHEILSEEADPCFGLVVDGRDVVDRLGSLPRDEDGGGGGGGLLVEPVRIVKTEIVGVDVAPFPRWGGSPSPKKEDEGVGSAGAGAGDGTKGEEEGQQQQQEGGAAEGSGGDAAASTAKTGGGEGAGGNAAASTGDGANGGDAHVAQPQPQQTEGDGTKKG